jgi:hypothetical protein
VAGENPLDELVLAYIGPNAAHRNFRIALGNAKALAFVLARGDSTVFSDFLAYAAEQRKNFVGGDCAFGVCGGPNTKTSVHLGVAISGREIDLIQAEGGFKSQALGLIYREVYRVFETYLVEIFEEIAAREKRVLYSGHKITHEEALRSNPDEIHRLIIEQRKAELTRVGFEGLEEEFGKLGLPIILQNPPEVIPEQNEIRRRLVFLSAARNVIEHNRSVVNREFLKLTESSNHKLGDRIVISSTELGDALWAVERAANGVNRRAVEKFSLA